jgi:hypothetical protein
MLAVLLTAVAFAAEPTSVPLIQTLPEDGSWVKFDLRLEGPNIDQTLTWTVRSVGNFQQAGKDLRCIETDLSGGTDLSPSVHRLLVPVEAFGENKHPLERAVKMWFFRGMEAPQAASGLEADAITAFFLGGPTSDVKKLAESEVVKWQRGELNCTAYTGQSKRMVNTALFDSDWKVLRHPEIPFGLAGLTLKINPGNPGEEIKVTMTLQDHGKNAEPALPSLVP